MRVRLVTIDLTAFLMGGARLVHVFWTRGPVASQNDLDKTVEGNFMAGSNMGGQGSVLIHHTDIPVRHIKFIAIRVISIDPTDRVVRWSVSGHED